MCSTTITLPRSRAGRAAHQSVVEAAVISARVDGADFLGYGQQQFAQVVRDGHQSSLGNIGVDTDQSFCEFHESTIESTNF